MPGFTHDPPWPRSDPGSDAAFPDNANGSRKIMQTQNNAPQYPAGYPLQVPPQAVPAQREAPARLSPEQDAALAYVAGQQLLTPGEQEVLARVDKKAYEPEPVCYPPRESVPLDASDQEDPGVAARDAERFEVYAEELLRNDDDWETFDDRAAHAHAIAALGVAYELKALRIQQAQSCATADALTGIQEAIAEMGKYLCGEIRASADATRAVACELSRFHADRTGEM